MVRRQRRSEALRLLGRLELHIVQPDEVLPAHRFLVAARDLDDQLVLAGGEVALAEDGKTVYKGSAAEFAAHAAALVKAGARFTGGCCGSTPESARELRKEIAARRLEV